MGTQIKNHGSKNRVNRGYLIGEENRIEIYTVVNLKIAEIETVEIKECLCCGKGLKCEFLKKSFIMNVPL